MRSLLPDLDTAWNQPREICRFLREKLPESQVFRLLHQLLYEQRIRPLKTLSEALWGDSGESACEATRRLLQAGAMARPDAAHSPLLPNRIHWSIRAPSGMFFSFAHEYAPDPGQIYHLNGQPVGYFYSSGYYSRPEQDTSHPLLVMRDSERGDWLLAGMLNGSGLEAGVEALPKTKERLEALLERLSLFRLDDGQHGGAAVIEFDPTSGKVGEPGGVRLVEVSMEDRKLERIKPIGSDSRLQLSIIAEGALVEMPPYPGDSKHWKPAQGRRLLVFSDSRREAATLGPTLTSNHERQMFRALVIRGLEQLGAVDLGALDDQLGQIRTLLKDLPEVARGAIEQQIDKLEDQKAAAQRGLPPAEFLNVMRGLPLVREFFDRPAGERHKADDWSQQVFERNESAVRDGLAHRLNQELARRTLWPDLNLESSGSLELVYPGLDDIQPADEFLGQLGSAEARKKISESFADFAGMMLDHARDLGAVTLGDDDVDSAYGIGGGYVGKWASLNDRYKNSLLPLCPANEDTMVGRFATLYLTTAGLSEQEVAGSWQSLVETLFSSLCNGTKTGRFTWLQFDKRQAEDNRMAQAFRIRFNELRIRPPLQLFQCQDSGQVWPRSALGCHLRSQRGSLERVEAADLMSNPRIARVIKEWGGSPVFQHGLWAEEHSAQISAQENRRLQDLFKAGIRNVLSSTTTLELGIDIGGLNGVMMGNIPPGKASYLQRAGRAGRRADGSSLVMSYSRNSPYERKVFEAFEGYIASPLRKPSVFLDRKDIVRRHLHSLLFGEFFLQAYGPSSSRGAMAAFGGMGPFLNVEQTSYWQANDPKPQLVKRDAQAELDQSFISGSEGASLADLFARYLADVATNLDESQQRRIRVLSDGTGLKAETVEEQQALINGLRDLVRQLVVGWGERYGELLTQWQSIPTTAERPQRNLANALHYQLKQLYGMTLIEAFSDAMVLPRYGFPIGLSELKVNLGRFSRRQEPVVRSEAYRLNRSASQAVSEYAPGSKILVGAKTVHSQGILKSWTGDDIPAEGMGLRAWFRWDEKKGDFRYKYQRFDAAEEDDQDLTREGEMLFVKHGFTTAASDPPKYGGSPSRVGKILTICRPPELAESTATFSDFFGLTNVTARLNVGGELLAINSGHYEYGFAVCTKCGYTQSEVKDNKDGKQVGRIGLPKGFEWHTPIHAEKEQMVCWTRDEALVLRRLHLAARQVCDFLEVDLPFVPGQSLERRRIANTISQALRLSGADLLNIDARELTILRPTSGSLTRVTISDSLAGGAGHVRDLAHDAERWWAVAVARLRESPPSRAMINLLTADTPERQGMPDLSIPDTVQYIAQVEACASFCPPEPQVEDEDFDPERFRHFRKR